jgi:hypothetical protein
VVDGAGVWLPAHGGDSLPEFTADGLPAPAGPRGTRYGQPDVEAAARIAAVCRGVDRLSLQRLDLGPEGFTLTTTLGRAFWGRAPASDTAGEPTAAVKRERLLRAEPWPAGVVLDLRQEEKPTDR